MGHPSYLKEPQMYDTMSMETYDEKETGRSFYSEYESGNEESVDVMPKYTATKKLKYDDHLEKAKLFSSKIMGRAEDTSDKYALPRFEKIQSYQTVSEGSEGRK